MYTEINKLKKELDSLRPLPKETVKSLKDDMTLRLTYNSNAIEGNTLTLNETKVVLEGITVGGKQLREHFEAVNHVEAIYWLEDLISNSEPISVRIIKQLHALILKNIDEKNAGVYRDKDVIISGASHTPPSSILLVEQMDNLLKNYSESEEHPVAKAAILHADFVKIHPFIDGNGRTGRLILNYALMLGGFLPIIISAKDRLTYYNVLDKASANGDYDDFIKMVIDLEKEMLEKYLSLIH